jgi:hypothetical protein
MSSFCVFIFFVQCKLLCVISNRKKRHPFVCFYCAENAPAFHKYVDEVTDRVVSLRGPSGHTWKVVLTSGSQGLGFTHGWVTF